MENSEEIKNEDHVVVTALPLNDAQLDKYFDNIEDYMFFVDIDTTELNARSILNYIYNSGMTCDFKLEEVTPENTEKLNALMLEYLKTDKLVYVDLLSELWGSVCLHILYPDLESPVEEVHTFVTQFIEKNKEVATEAATAVASLYYFLLGLLIDGNEECGGLPHNKLSDNIGANIVNLRRSGNFWSFFMNIADYKGEVYNFDDFSELKYEGYGAAHFFFDEFGPFASIAEMNEAKKKQ